MPAGTLGSSLGTTSFFSFIGKFPDVFFNQFYLPGGWVLVDGALFIAIFIGLLDSLLKEKFNTDGGKKAVNALGLALALGLLFAEYSADIKIFDLGGFAVVIFGLLLGYGLYEVVRRITSHYWFSVVFGVSTGLFFTSIFLSKIASSVKAGKTDLLVAIIGTDAIGFMFVIAIMLLLVTGVMYGLSVLLQSRFPRNSDGNPAGSGGGGGGGGAGSGDAAPGGGAPAGPGPAGEPEVSVTERRRAAGSKRFVEGVWGAVQQLHEQIVTGQVAYQELNDILSATPIPISGSAAVIPVDITAAFPAVTSSFGVITTSISRLKLDVARVRTLANVFTGARKSSLTNQAELLKSVMVTFAATNRILTSNQFLFDSTVFETLINSKVAAATAGGLTAITTSQYQAEFDQFSVLLAQLQQLSGIFEEKTTGWFEATKKTQHGLLSISEQVVRVIEEIE